MAFASYLVDNDRRFRDALTRAASVSDDLRIPFGMILTDFYRSEEAIFKLQGPGQYPDFKNGGSKSRYAKMKERKYGFMYPLLVRTGRLADSLTDPSAAESIAEISKDSLVIGSSVPYFAYHQSDEPRRKIPLRKALFIGPEAPQFASSDQTGRPERWMNILNDYTLSKMRQSGAFK